MERKPEGLTVGDEDTTVFAGSVSDSNSVGMRMETIDDKPKVWSIVLIRPEQTDHSWVTMMYRRHGALKSARGI
jgi:hypothetical protein